MKSHDSFLRLVVLGAASLVIPFSAHAQNNDDGDWDHFGLNFRAAFNVRAKFSEASGGGAGTLPPGPGTGLGMNHQYSDGFVNADSSGNKGGVTWNWGYANASQISGGDVLMHATGGTGGGTSSVTDNPDPGFDLNYVHDIAHAGWGRWGLKFGVGYTPLDIRDQSPMSMSGESITDKYALNGVTPPLAPYSGSFNGPGPVLGSEPISRTISGMPGTAMLLGDRRINGGLFDLRLGPSVNIPFCRHLSMEAGGGFALGIVSSHFTFTESSEGGTPVSGSNTRAGFLPGAYGELGLAYRVSRAASFFTGAQFEYLGDFHQNTVGRSAELDLGATIFYELGLQWHF